MNIYQSNAMVEQYRFPRTGRKRTQKKWACNPDNWRPMRAAMRIGGWFVCHPQFYATLSRAMESL